MALKENWIHSQKRGLAMMAGNPSMPKDWMSLNTSCWERKTALPAFTGFLEIMRSGLGAKQDGGLL